MYRKNKKFAAHITGIIVTIYLTFLGGCQCETEFSNNMSETFNDIDISYEAKNIDIPTYDSNNTEMFIIDEDDDWDHINDPDKRIFFVAPGDYSNYNGQGFIRLSSSGTTENPRYLVYYNPSDPNNNDHPVNMAVNEQAVIKLFWLIGASNWIIDRIVVRDSQYTNRIIGAGDTTRNDVTSDGYAVDTGTSGPFTPSENNILNRMLFEDAFANSIFIYEGCHYNIIQNSVIRKNSPPDGDWVAICLQAWKGRKGHATIANTRIISNEIYNDNDGIQLFHHSTIEAQGQTPDYLATIISDNDIYITIALYSDGSGNLTTGGSYAAAENAIDIKSSSSSSAPNHWVRIINNRMWGFRYLDTYLAGSSASGETIVIHQGGSSIGDTNSGYILIQDNLIMDSVNGLYITKQNHISVINNIIYDIKNPVGGEWSIALFIGGRNHEIYSNIIIDIDSEWFRASNNASDSSNWDMRNNAIINSSTYEYNPPLDSGAIADYNFYYNVTDSFDYPGTNDQVYGSADDSGNTTLDITRKKITAPETIQIPYGQTNTDSPHYSTGDPNLGSRKDMGVDNGLY